jgi:hypothetical protein
VCVEGVRSVLVVEYPLQLSHTHTCTSPAPTCHYQPPLTRTELHHTVTLYQCRLFCRCCLAGGGITPPTDSPAFYCEAFRCLHKSNGSDKVYMNVAHTPAVRTSAKKHA